MHLQGIDTELEDRHYSDNAVTVDMLVKRAQQWDEGEMYKRGQARLGDGSEDDDDDDPRTDIDTLYNLDSVRSASLSDEDIIGLNKWTAVGAKEELPDAHEDEDVVLAEGYDAKKAEEEEKKNQADTANFSGGGKRRVIHKSANSVLTHIDPVIDRMVQVGSGYLHSFTLLKTDVNNRQNRSRSVVFEELGRSRFGDFVELMGPFKKADHNELQSY